MLAVVGAAVLAVVGAAVLAVVGAAVLAVVVVVAALLQVTLQPLAPAPFFLPSLMNSITISEVEVNTNFFLFPQTLNRRDMT